MPIDLPVLPSSYATAPRHSWEYNRYCIQHNLKSDDWSSFIRWSTIQATMYVGDAGYTQRMIDALSALDRWGKYRSACALPEPSFGAKSSKLLPGTSPNLIRQAFHLSRWEQATGLTIDQMDSVVEIGGGYGDLCLLVHRLGFKGDYYLLDLPEFLLLQEYYLTAHLPKADIHFGCKPDLVNLQIAIYSLSESPLAARDGLLLDADSYLFAYQPKWGGADNRAYFRELSSDIGIEWYIDTGPPATNYLIGI